MKKMIILPAAVLAACVLLFSGCGSNSQQPAAETKTLNMDILQAEGSPIHSGAVRFGELVKEYTDGRYEVAVFPNCALGNGIQATSTEMVQKGTLDMVATSFNLFIASEPSFAVLNLPWLLAGDD
ncbi:MAG: hypothetical protein FWG32_06435, partial [Oscillospiraceae bacterium]|nr:hypothetical protein [Oscillospiraceae bacterium]